MPDVTRAVILIRCARAVALLSQCDNAFDESVHKEAAGAVCALLDEAEAALAAWPLSRYEQARIKGTRE